MIAERSIDDTMIFEIRDLNLAYLLMVRRFARESIEEASVRLGVPADDLAKIAEMDSTDIKKLASGSVMMMRPRFALPLPSASQLARSISKESRRLVAL